MFNQFLRLLGVLPPERHIFKFRVGRRMRRADPVLISLLLAEHSEYLPRHLAEARAGDLDAIEVCGRAACEAFGVKSVQRDEKNGLTLSDCLRLLMAFDFWQMALRRKHDAFCRLAAIHGVDIGNLDAERFCALYFTRQENTVRQADVVRLGSRASMGKLPLPWFIATRDTIDEAKHAHDQHAAAIDSQIARRGIS